MGRFLALRNFILESATTAEANGNTGGLGRDAILPFYGFPRIEHIANFMDLLEQVDLNFDWLRHVDSAYVAVVQCWVKC